MSAPFLVSACLAGVPCRYDGGAKPDAAIVRAVAEGRALPACAEVAGGLPTPRPPAEIRGGDGADVLRGTARVVTEQGADVTAEFVDGARRVADEAVARRWRRGPGGGPEGAGNRGHPARAKRSRRFRRR